MSRTLTEAKIMTREQRRKLPEGIHWRGIDPDVHLGYRKGKRGGKWLARWYVGGGEGYQQKTFATADDEVSEGTLDFNGAVRGARGLVEDGRRDARAVSAGPPLTVRSVVTSYCAGRDARDTARKGRAARSDATSRLTRYVTGQPKNGKRAERTSAALAECGLQALSEGDLIAWRASLPPTLKSTTKRRLTNDLKAALNAGYAVNRDRLPTTLPATIKHGLSAIEDFDAAHDPVARENQILTDAQVSRILEGAREVDRDASADGDLYRLIVILAATGARFSQVVRMRVADVQRDAGRLQVPVSRKGRGGKSGTTPIPVGRDVLDALLPAMTGRSADAILLERWLSKQASGSIRWERAGRGPWQSASELIRPWGAIKRRAELPDAIPYALRHSSIVRGIRANLPIRLVAALHDTSVAMIERHYGRWIADGLEDLAARAVVPLVPNAGQDNVVRLTQA